MKAWRLASMSCIVMMTGPPSRLLNRIRPTFMLLTLPSTCLAVAFMISERDIVTLAVEAVPSR
jgi:hypothetical protein